MASAMPPLGPRPVDKDGRHTGEDRRLLHEPSIAEPMRIIE